MAPMVLLVEVLVQTAWPSLAVLQVDTIAILLVGLLESYVDQWQ